MLLDVAKGVLCAAVVSRLPLGHVPIDPQTLAVLCGVVAVLGHVFPIYIGFRGGKGVGTAAGMLIATAPIPILFALGMFAACLFVSGCVSCGSILAAWTVPIGILLLDQLSSIRHPTVLLAITLALAAFITFTHRKNIGRILRGEEKTFPQLQLWRRWIRR
jgi:glycerol-3-phosphate acyltransferase PlsY